MLVRRCWTCQQEHDLDEACLNSMRARSKAAASGQGVYARYHGTCEVCGRGMQAGQRIVAHPSEDGTWIHEECEEDAQHGG